MKSICNPINLRYLYQVIRENEKLSIGREAADISVRLFKDRYYMFASMTKGFYHSEDLVKWEYRETPGLPVYGYAPDVCIIDDYMYVCASSREKCAFYRTKDPLKNAFEEIPTELIFWDPNLFQDDDGRVYLYWGCSDRDPIWGIELDKHSMKPRGEKVVLVSGDPESHGWERLAENNDLRLRVKHPYFTGGPFIEGAWMTKNNGTYYLQYAAPGTEYNVYSDGVYISDHPLGPFSYAKHNPASSKPGGFITGAGHGSTFQDTYGNWWHASTMRISVNHTFERRLGLFPAAFDADGIFCINQVFADYPMMIPESKIDIWDKKLQPWMLLSYKKETEASSFAPGFEPCNAVNEDIRNYWMAADNKPGQYLCVDLGNIYQVNAIQLNLGDHIVPQSFMINFREDEWVGEQSKRIIDSNSGAAEYTIEASENKKSWKMLKDARGSTEDHSHEYLSFETPLNIRYVRVTGYRMPYDASFTVSGLRVFGAGKKSPPARVIEVKADRKGPLNVLLSWKISDNAAGYNVRYGIAKDKLYSNWLLYEKTELDLGMLTKGQKYFIRIDAFNESGITEGDVIEV